MARKNKEPVLGPCIECGKPQYLSQEYIVRGDIWNAAGMYGWAAGHLHRHCLEKRLGRRLTPDDLLVWHVKGNQFAAHPDYLTSPEYLEHS